MSISRDLSIPKKTISDFVTRIANWMPEKGADLSRGRKQVINNTSDHKFDTIIV
jgi:hypothetical protein